jgi:hypothetical protein
VEGLQAAGGVADVEFHARVVEGAGGSDGSCARRVSTTARSSSATTMWVIEGA